MVLLALFLNPDRAVLYWLSLSIAYYFVLKKMNLRTWTCVIPFVADWEFSHVVFSRMRTFYRPFAISAIFVTAAMYLGLEENLGWIYLILATIVYGVFLARLYWQIAKSFGKGILFRIGMILVPFIFLLILGLGKAIYTPLKLKQLKEYPLLYRILYYLVIGGISVAEIVILMLVVGFFTIRTTPPAILVYKNLSDIGEKTAGIKGNNEYLTREEMMGSDYNYVSTVTPSREHFYPDHSNDQEAVVLVYVVGSNLENKGGLASANISQMIDATKKGEGLTFVMQAGGSRRWFTQGIDEGTYGRYSIHGGKLSKEMDLADDMSMSDKESLTDFLIWAKEKYPNRRTMLVLWDHGGGVAAGYGHDDLNKKHTEEENEETMQVYEILDALKTSGIRFDLIGFDACLMQDIEIAASMEPYTDYYLASEETEGGYGWYYTSAFGRLAENPGISTEEFGAEMLSCFDQYNTIIADGKTDTTSTLSLIDTTLAKPAYEKFCGLLEKADQAFRESSGSYADMAASGMNAYNFNDNLQIDLIDYLSILEKADYDDSIASDEEITSVINAIRSCILMRNKNSAEGINGMAFAFPYKALYLYGDTSKNLGKMSLSKQQSVFNDFFSIMAAQKKKAAENGKTGSTGASATTTSDLLNEIANSQDYTQESWYVKGFEDYDDTEAIIDIPLQESEKGYQIQLPENVWNIIADCKTAAYEKYQIDEESTGLRYLGTDYIGDGTGDANGHPMINMDGYWVSVDGQIICYEADQVRASKEGTVFTGKSRARLNDQEDIVLYIQWEPAKEGSEEERIGHIIGYDNESSALLGSLFDTKGMLSLKAGDTIQFIFSKYDSEGNLIGSEPEGKQIYVTSQDRLKVTDKLIEGSDIVFNGVLTDIYQRIMTTESVEMHIGEN